MNKNLTCAVGALAAGLALAPAAHAQIGPSLPLIGAPSAISVGAFVPSSSAAKSGGNTQFDVEFRYGIPLPNPTPLIPVIGVGVETGSKSGSRSTIVPVTVGLDVGLNGLSANAAGAVYAGGGIGYYFINQHQGGNVIDQLGTHNRVGGYGELGYNFTRLIFLNAKYQFADRADGLSATVGLRF